MKLTVSRSSSSANRSHTTCCTKTLLTVNPGHMPVTQPVWLTTVAETTNAIPDPSPKRTTLFEDFSLVTAIETYAVDP
jgi:hypothetical protein